MDRPPLGDVEDLATLAKLDEQILLKELKERYRQNKIYTYVGDILIAINPFKDLQIYGKDESAKYHKAKKSSLPPHIFAVADASYSAMLGLQGCLPCNQCILISGESGAGKTESTKLIIKQLIDLCQGNSQLEQQILQVNPLLEAFGNAQTNLNDNSSRFGKYIQLKFKQGQVMGAKISEYLLEKSRVVRQNIGEENFHIFSYLFAGLTPDVNKHLHLGEPRKYRYFNNGMTTFSKKFSELQQQYYELINAMDLVGFTDNEQADVFCMIASVLHLGNVTFTTTDHDGAMTDSNGPIKMVSKLLAIDSDEVQACLTSMVTVTKGEYVKRLYSVEQAEDARDAMAKTIYGRLFGWIVNKINCLLASEEIIPEDQLKEIGILDIFGFEHFEKNSFEQACINLANEQLQFFFNQHIFKMEQEEYKREGIDWNEITFVDNKPLLDMFLMKPIGLLALLDEESHFPRATDQTFVDKVNQHFMKNPYFIKSPSSKIPVFSINHYAGKVTYDATQWLEKNRDTLPGGIMEILQSSKIPLVRTIFRGQITRTGSLALQGRTIRSSKRSRKITPVFNQKNAAKRKLTVGAQFKNSLNILMEKMTSATPIFVRCLKPNHLKKADMFSDEYILAQLLYTGMLETTKIRREGFAVRPSFEEFVQKYKVIMCQSRMTGTAGNCSAILRTSRLTGWHVGKTKVFLKYWHIEQLADILARMGDSAIHLQRVVRGFLARRRCQRLRMKARQQAEDIEQFLYMVEKLGVATSTFQSQLAEEDKKKHPKNEKKVNVPPPPPVHPHPHSPPSDYLQPTKTTASCGTQVEDDGSDDDIIDDDFQPVVSNKNKFGQPGTKQATAVWFRETQTDNVIDENSGKCAHWFHGIITRRQSEELLRHKIVGCYLIRVSESRFGYTLSFKDVERCRHYMIDQLKNGKFIIKGEPKVHKTLHDIIEYHKKNPISNWNGRLTVPCGQEQGECDYVDLMDETYFVLEESKVSRHSVAPDTMIQQQDSVPVLPPRTYNVLSQPSEPPKRMSHMAGRPLPQLPEQYNRLLENQVEQHRYDPLIHNGRDHKRMSAARSRLH